MSTTAATPDSQQPEAPASTRAMRVDVEVLRAAYDAAMGEHWDDLTPADRDKHEAFAAELLRGLLGHTQVTGPPEPAWDERVQAAISSRFTREVVKLAKEDPAYVVLSDYLWRKYTEGIEPTIVVAGLSDTNHALVNNSYRPAARLHLYLATA